MYNFLSTGDLGDLIYCLPLFKYVEKANLLINTDIDWAEKTSGFYKTKVDGTKGGFTEKSFDYLYSLLKKQNYVNDVNFFDTKKKYENLENLDFFRKHYSVSQIYGKIAMLANIPIKEWNEPWIKVKPLHRYKVLFSSTSRHLCHNFPWIKLVNKFKKFSGFIGLQSEYFEFIKKYFNNQRIIPYCYTSSALDMAETIAGCKLFIGNQSFPFALAESMKKNAILACSSRKQDCMFIRNNILFFMHGKFLKVKNDFKFI